MTIKKKSLVLGMISSLVLCSVVTLTLFGYFFYLQLKEKEAKREYLELLHGVNAKAYAKHIEIVKLEARIEKAGVLRGEPLIEGVIKNNGPKNLNDIVLKLKFLNHDGASIYGTAIRPHESYLISSGRSQIPIPRLSSSSKIVLRAYGELAFKKILTPCPEAIISELKNGVIFSKSSLTELGKINYEITSVTFHE